MWPRLEIRSVAPFLGSSSCSPPFSSACTNESFGVAGRGSTVMNLHPASPVPSYWQYRFPYLSYLFISSRLVTPRSDPTTSIGSQARRDDTRTVGKNMPLSHLI